MFLSIFVSLIALTTCFHCPPLSIGNIGTEALPMMAEDLQLELQSSIYAVDWSSLERMAKFFKVEYEGKTKLFVAKRVALRLDDEIEKLKEAEVQKSADMGKQQYDKKVRHTTLREGDRVLVRNMTERGGPGKLRSYWEQEIHVVTQKREDMPVYEVKPETGNGRTRVLHRNLLLPCSFLPVEIPPKPSKSRRTMPRTTRRQQELQENTTRTTDENIPGLTPGQLQEFYESTRNHTEDNCQIVPEFDEHDTYPCQVDGPGSEGEAEDTEQPSGAFDDEAVDGVPLRQSQRVSRPPLRMTYDAMGQPSFQPSSTTGIRGITASYPHQLWQPVPVSWMVQQPVFQPFSYFVPFPVNVQPMYPVPAWRYQQAWWH